MARNCYENYPNTHGFPCNLCEDLSACRTQAYQNGKLNDNELRCETCGISHHEVIIIEKPKRMGYKGKIVQIEQKSTDGSKQENICFSCLSKVLHYMSK